MTSPINEKTVLRVSAVAVLGASLALAVWRAASGISLFFGGMIGVLAFKMLCLDADRILRSSLSTAPRLARRGYFKRLLFYAAALSISLQSDMLSFGWVLAGLLTPKLVIYGLFALRRIRSGN